MYLRSFFSIAFIFFMTFTSTAQQANNVQRGQRGYTPPPKYNASTFIELHEVHEESLMILSKCEKPFNLDAFQKEIMKSMLIKKFEDENAILSDKGNTREDRRKKVIDRNNVFLKDLGSILTTEQVDQFKIMDFTETKEDKKEKKKNRKKNRKNNS